MKVAFVTSHYENLGLEYLSARMKAEGRRVRLFFEPGLFHNFFMERGFLHRLFSFDEHILRGIEEWKPDIAAFSVISDNYGWTLRMAREIKRRTGAVIVFGGVHPTSVPDFVLEDGVADYLVLGEGEDAFSELVSSIERGEDASGLRNIACVRDGRKIINPLRPPIPGLDGLPFPDKDLFFEECPAAVRASYMLLGSRGCPNSCSYCWNSMTHRVYPGGVYFRRRSPQNVIAELRAAKARYGIKKVTFYDEVFTDDQAWLKTFLELYRDEIGLPFFCCVHPDAVNEESVKLLSDAGCAAINIGIQTINEETRVRVLGRPGNNDSVSRAMKLLRASKIFVYSNIMLGLPGEGEEEVVRTLRFCAEHKADLPAIYWLRYYPGTRIVNLACERGMLTAAQVKEINQSREYLPYAITGNTYSKNIQRLGNLILLTGVLPERFVNYVADKKLYRYFYGGNLLFPVILLVGWGKMLFCGKRNPFHYFGFRDYAAYYLRYSFRRLLVAVGL